MDNKLADAEMTPKFCLSLIEEFVEEYQDALDYFRQDLARYYSNPPTATSAGATSHCEVGATTSPRC